MVSYLIGIKYNPQKKENMYRDKSGSSSDRCISTIYKDPDAEWKRIQQNTFTRWVNQHLKKSNQSITDLETGFSDGLRLISLIEALSHKEVPNCKNRNGLYEFSL